jgi:hypothetical protein
MSKKAPAKAKTPTSKNKASKFRKGGKGGKSPTDPIPQGRKITQRERTERPRGRDKDITKPAKGNPELGDDNGDDNGMWGHLGDDE